MKTTAYHSNNEIYPIVGLLCAILVVTVLGGAGLLTMRHQIATSARHTTQMQTAIAQMDRRLNYLDTKIAEVNQPAYLHRRSSELGLVLESPRRGQVVRLHERRSTPSTIVAQERRELGEPFMQTFDLAVMEPLRRLD